MDSGAIHEPEYMIFVFDLVRERGQHYLNLFHIEDV
jgi:hypothetical protein